MSVSFWERIWGPRFFKPRVDIRKYPTKCYGFKSLCTAAFTLGDMHGNALKLFHALVKMNVFKVSKANYERFEGIYKVSLLSNVDERLKKLLHDVEVNHQTAVRLLGDELCDRGHNDAVTMALMEHMADHSLQFTILVSNHGMDFVRDVCGLGQQLRSDHTRSKNKFKTHEKDWQARSRKFLKDYYLPRLKLIDFDSTTQTLYAHAPITPAFVLGVAEVLGITIEGYCGSESVFGDNDQLRLDATFTSGKDISPLIGQINSCFRTKLKACIDPQADSSETYNDGSSDKLKFLKAITHRDTIEALSNGKATFNKENIIAACFENRSFDVFNQCNLGCITRVVHGHTSTKYPEEKHGKRVVRDHVVNLDNQLGKNDKGSRGGLLTDCPKNKLVLVSKTWWLRLVESKWGLSLIGGAATALSLIYASSFSLFSSSAVVLFSSMAISSVAATGMIFGLIAACGILAMISGLHALWGYDYAASNTYDYAAPNTYDYAAPNTIVAVKLGSCGDDPDSAPESDPKLKTPPGAGQTPGLSNSSC